MEEKNVFIIGSNGIPAKYGGFETFVENLTAKRKNDKIKYHVACIKNSKTDSNEFYYNNARCFNINVPNIGPAKAEYYDLIALEKTIKYIKKNKIENATIYILGTGVGLFVSFYKRRLHKLGAKVFVNPDGCEWKRAKWNAILKKFFKVCEAKMAKHADLLICDSISMENYIKEEYKNYSPNTTFIAYGSEFVSDEEQEDKETCNKLKSWYKENEIKEKEYYLIVGRFVPENNYETMIKEFMKCSTKKDLVIITNVEKNKFYETLRENTEFDKDKRIKFVGTVYDSKLLSLIRKNAYAYLHGHEVGGTNPSLLEALATTNLNLLLDVGFNEEVAKSAAMYWNKEDGNLCKLLNETENLSFEQKIEYGVKAKRRIRYEYNWDKIVEKYEELFLQ